MTTTIRSRAAAGVTLLIATSLALTACGTDPAGRTETKENQNKPGASAKPVTDPLVATYEGGLHVLDGRTLKVVKDMPMAGFNRVNPAGDDRHVIVSTSEGFRVMDAVDQRLTDIEFKGPKPGHVVRHADRTVLFTDGTGRITSFDPHDLAGGEPATTTYTSAAPHHGVAVELKNGRLVSTLGTEEKRTGLIVLDKDRKEITRNEQCPGNRSDTTAYLLYAARSAERDGPDDLNGDGNRGIWTLDKQGSLLTYAGQGNGKFSAFRARGPPAFSVQEVDPPRSPFHGSLRALRWAGGR
ncbi:hypothetical protein [Streptomyces sp. NPDC055632]